jgi:hypothetical protein
MINRLIVLLQIFIFPLYFYLWFWTEPVRSLSLESFIWWDPPGTDAIPDTTEMILIRIVTPLIFALPFTLASLIRATKIANSYELMWRAMGKVRIDTKLFYMVNAIFCLFFFILPFGSPVIAVFGAFFAVKLILHAFGVKKDVPAILVVIPGLFLAAIPLMVAIAFYMEYAAIIKPIWDTWVNYSTIFYGIVLCLACALAIGNFFLFIREGASEVSYTKPYNERIGLIIKIFLFAGFLLIYFFAASRDASHYSMFIVNGIAIGLSGIEAIVRWRKKGTGTKVGLGGTLMVPIFIAVNFIARYRASFITAVVALSACIFFVLFVLAYRYADDETLFE